MPPAGSRKLPEAESILAFMCLMESEKLALVRLTPSIFHALCARNRARGMPGLVPMDPPVRSLTISSLTN